MEERLCHFHKISAISRSFLARGNERSNVHIYKMRSDCFPARPRRSGRVGSTWTRREMKRGLVHVGSCLDQGNIFNRINLSSIFHRVFCIPCTRYDGEVFPWKGFSFILINEISSFVIFVFGKKVTELHTCLYKYILLISIIYIYYLFKVFSIIMLYKHYCDARSTSRWWRKNLFNTFK